MNKSVDFYEEKQQIKYIYLQADIESLLLKVKAEITDNKTTELGEILRASG